MIRIGLLLIVAALALPGQDHDPAANPLRRAYESLRVRHYDAAIQFFREALELAPTRAAIRKDLAYTHLKTGETESARDQFAEAMRLDPNDYHAALEYAFLCYETRKTAEAYRVFDRVRKTGDAASRQTAGQAFENIDRLLAEGIDRWTAALKLQPNDFSAHHELARSALDRGDARLAAEHFEQAWRLRPDLPSVLVELGRAWTELGESQRAMAAFLAASRGTEPRAAEEARALLPVRPPGDHELCNAIELDPRNAELRRELAHLLAAAGKTQEAAAEVVMLPKSSPATAPSVDPKEMGRRSYEKGYLPDALTYYSMAHEADPLDFEVLLKLGWTNNLLRRDREAARWFALAKKSPDPGISREASRAERQIRPSAARFRTSAWFFPSYSSRWRDMFTYGQAKVEMRLGSLPLRTYLSTRFIGDTRTAANSNLPQYLSESSFIFGAGIATDAWRGITLWGEAGSAVNYLGNRRDLPRAAPDYRGGVAFHRGFGRLLGSTTSGAFYETNADGVFISRFQNDFVLYDQNRFGFTLPAVEPLGGLQTQLYWNANASADARSQSWANTVETGPGVRLRWKAMPPGWLFSVDFVRGAYTRNEGNSQRPNYFDLRIGVWYSLTR